VEQDGDYRDAFRTGLRRAALHWVRASYEVIAGVGAILDEVAQVRRDTEDEQDHTQDDDDGPIRIELD
jgi:hypothetical protein